MITFYVLSMISIRKSTVRKKLQHICVTHLIEWWIIARNRAPHLYEQATCLSSYMYLKIDSETSIWP